MSTNIPQQKRLIALLKDVDLHTAGDYVARVLAARKYLVTDVYATNTVGDPTAQVCTLASNGTTLVSDSGNISSSNPTDVQSVTLATTTTMLSSQNITFTVNTPSNNACLIDIYIFGVVFEASGPMTID